MILVSFRWEDIPPSIPDRLIKYFTDIEPLRSQNQQFLDDQSDRSVGQRCLDFLSHFQVPAPSINRNPDGGRASAVGCAGAVWCGG
jgi:hypothetical protein